MGKIKHFGNIHFPEVQPYKPYSFHEFRKRNIRLFKTPDLSHVNIKELMTAQQKQDESVVPYMRRVQENVAKAFPKLADANRQNLTLSIFWQGLRDQGLAVQFCNV